MAYTAGRWITRCMKRADEKGWKTHWFCPSADYANFAFSMSSSSFFLLSAVFHLEFRLASYVGGESRWFPLAVKFDTDFGNYGNFAVPSLPGIRIA